MYLFFWWLAIRYACSNNKEHPHHPHTLSPPINVLYHHQSMYWIIQIYKPLWAKFSQTPYGWRVLLSTLLSSSLRNSSAHHYNTAAILSFIFFCRVSVLFDSDLLVWQHIYSFAMCHRHGEDNYHMSPKVNYHSQRLDPYICTSNGCPVVCLGWSLGYSAIDRYVQNVSIQTDTNNNCDNHSTICIRAVFMIWCRWRNIIPGCNHEFTRHYRFYDIMEEE